MVLHTRRFYSPDWLRLAARDTHLDIVGGGGEWCSPDFLIERETFPHLAFEFILSGRGRIRLGSEWHDVSSGSTFFFDHTIPHSIRSDPEDPLVKYFFNFAGERARALLEEFKLKPGEIFRVAQPARVAGLLDEAIDFALHDGPLSLRAASAVLEHSLVLCAEARRPAQAATDPAYDAYLRCRSLILQQYPGLVSITQAARACAVSPAYLTRLFQRYDHETPCECLRRLKLNDALHRLRQSNVQAKTVAAELSYKSAAHFSRAFKQFHGMTPREALQRG